MTQHTNNTKSAHIDELIQRAGKALSDRNYFEAERVALRALGMARESRDYERMGRLGPTLLDARRKRLQQALDTKTLHIVDEPFNEDFEIEPGCYLIVPILVGADARRLRLLAWQREIPVATLCCEPETRLGLWPVVAVTPGYTMRTHVEPPEDPDHPDADWLAWAMEQLGDFAIESIDDALEPHRRVETLLERLDALPEHESLNQAFIDACCDAHREQVEAARRKADKADKAASRSQ